MAVPMQQAQPMMTYQILVPEGVTPGMTFQANIGGMIQNITCPEGVAPGASIQVQGPAPAAAGVPMAQMMQDADGGMARILGAQKGLLIRQKLDKWELILPLWEKRNKYKVAGFPEEHRDTPYADWDDKIFKKALKKNEVLTMKEKSECLDRICCGKYRSFKMKVKAGDDAKGSNDDDGKILEFDRPCACTINCFNLCLLMPQELKVADKNDKNLGRITQVLKFPGSCCFKSYWEVKDDKDETRYTIVDNCCHGCNCCAPSICPGAAVREMQIMQGSSEDEVGKFMNVFPGCNLRACLGDADNFILDFPAEATVEDKALLLGASVLVDFMLFEKDEQDNGGGMSAAM